MDPRSLIATAGRTIRGVRVPPALAIAISTMTMLSALMGAPATPRGVDLAIDSALGTAVPFMRDLQPPGDLPHSRVALEQWAHRHVRGLRVVDLTGIDLVTARELVSVAAGLSWDLHVDVEVLAPRARWNELTGQPSADSPMFANRFGVGVDPTWWSAYRARAAGNSGNTPATSTDPHVRAYAAHEIAHVWEDTVSARASSETARGLRILVENYRSALGKDAVICELGSYGWNGGSDDPRDAWKETWAEAFAHYATDRARTSQATRALVARALLLYSPPQPND
ncbi:MAG: hypothetical protein ACYCX3_06295 [Thermoleophilia bacterium]